MLLIKRATDGHLSSQKWLGSNIQISTIRRHIEDQAAGACTKIILNFVVSRLERLYDITLHSNLGQVF